MPQVQSSPSTSTILRGVNEGSRTESEEEGHKTTAGCCGASRLLSPSQDQSGVGRGIAESKAIALLLHGLGITEGGCKYAAMQSFGTDSAERTEPVFVTRSCVKETDRDCRQDGEIGVRAMSHQRKLVQGRQLRTNSASVTNSEPGQVSRDEQCPSRITPRVLSVDELASLFCYSTEKIKRLARRRELPAFKFGKSWFIREQDLKLYVNRAVEMSMQPPKQKR